MARFVIRLDDVCPTMDHAKFSRARVHFEAAGVRPLLGVVPDNKDPDLEIDPPDSRFWETMRGLRKQGWGISQHGYQHRIHTDNRGLLGITPRSEFAGRPLEDQRGDLAAGQAILVENGIGTDVFMAPFHSYDSATLIALKDLGFTTLTDGYGLYPWRDNGLMFVPQLFERPANLGFGTYTMCLHLNNMTLDDIDRLGGFMMANSRRFIDFDTAREGAWPAVLARPIGLSLKLGLTAKRRFGAPR